MKPLLAALGIVVAMGAARVPAQQPDLLYVCVQDDAKVAVVDMTSRKVLRTIDFGLANGRRRPLHPHDRFRPTT